MSDLLVGSFALTRGTYITAKVQAYNSKGWSYISSASDNGPVVETIPDQMTAPTRVSTTSTSTIVVEWSALTNPSNGGSTITSYFLEWDAGTSGATWSEVVGYSPASLATSYSVTGGTSGLTAGASYKFRVTARNIYGWGPVSSVSTIKASTIPGAIPSVITSIDSTTGGVQVSWGASNWNGETIQYYTIEVNTYQTSTWSTTSVCNGASSPVMNSLSCVIPMSTLTALFAYPFDALVLVRVTAHNLWGDGPSAYNLGSARIRSKPAAMTAPTIVSYSDTQIVVSWASLTGTNTGNSAITSYNLYWNDGTGEADIQVIDALSNTYTFGAISGGLTYKFKVRAKNIYDYGDFSDTTSLVAIDVPGKVSIPTVTLLSTGVVVDWV